MPTFSTLFATKTATFKVAVRSERSDVYIDACSTQFEYTVAARLPSKTVWWSYPRQCILADRELYPLKIVSVCTKHMDYSIPLSYGCHIDPPLTSMV